MKLLTQKIDCMHVHAWTGLLFRTSHPFDYGNELTSCMPKGSSSVSDVISALT